MHPAIPSVGCAEDKGKAEAGHIAKQKRGDGEKKKKN